MVLEAKCHRRFDGNRSWATTEAHRARGAQDREGLPWDSTKERDNNYIHFMRDRLTPSQLCL